jgi:hypothetical protein
MCKFRLDVYTGKSINLRMCHAALDTNRHLDFARVAIYCNPSPGGSIEMTGNDPNQQHQGLSLCSKAADVMTKFVFSLICLGWRLASSRVFRQ